MKRPLLHIPAFIVAVLALIAIASCSGRPQYGHNLLHADSIMEEHPDSAFTLLAAIDTDALRNTADSALYGLLVTQASVKTDATLPPDTLIGRALAFYRNADDPDRLMRSLFYDAYLRSTSNPRISILNALEAYEMASVADDPYWMAKCTELLGDIQSQTYNYSEAADYYSNASNNYDKSGRKLSSLLSAIDSQRCLLMCTSSGDTSTIQKIIANIDSISGNATAEYEEIVLSNSGRIKCYAALRAHDSGLTSRILAEMDSTRRWEIFNDPEERARLHLQAAMERDDISEIKRIMQDFNKDSISEATSIVTTLAHVRLLRESNRHKEAADSLYSLFSSLDAQTRGLITNPLVNVHRNYLRRLVGEKERNNILLRWIIIAVTIISLLVVAVLILANRYLTKSKLLQLNQKTELLENVIDSLRKLESQNESLHQENSSMQLKMQEYANLLQETDASEVNEIESEENIISLKEKYHMRISELESELKSKTSDSVCYRDITRSIIHEGIKGFRLMTHLAANSNSSDINIILKEIERSIEWMRLDSTCKIIEESVNESHNDVIARLRRQCAFLNEKDIRFVCLIYAGLSIKHVSMIMKFSGNYGYNKRKRISEAITHSDAPGREEFLTLLMAKKKETRD